MGTLSKKLGTRARPGRLVTFELEGETVSVELRQLSMAAKGQLARAAGVKESGEVPDINRLVSSVLIACAYEPGTGTRAFDEADLDALVAAGPELDPLQSAALDLLQGPKDAVGESKPTPS